MSEDDNSEPSIDRRSVLRGVGTASAISIFGVSSASARRGRRGGESNKDQADPTVVASIELDTGGRENLEAASVAIVRSGDIIKSRADITVSHDVPADRSAESTGPVGTSYSVSLDPNAAEEAVSGAGAVEAVGSGDQASNLDQDDFTIDKTSVDDLSLGDGGVSAQGLSEPNYGTNWDGGAWVETNSSECGTLARSTSVWDNDWNSNHYEFGNNSIVTSAVDGAACDGESFGDRFPCDDIPYLYDCSVPDEFNTTWSTQSYDYGKSNGDLTHSASFQNTDFPLIPETNADHSADVYWTGDTNAEISGSADHYGSINEAINFLLKWDIGISFW